jgi:hypothetical protein
MSAWRQDCCVCVTVNITQLLPYVCAGGLGALAPSCQEWQGGVPEGAAGQGSHSEPGYQCQHGVRTAKLVPLLTSRKCCPVSMQEGWVPLHLAATNRHLECLRELLHRGAAVDHAANPVSTEPRLLCFFCCGHGCCMLLCVYAAWHASPAVGYSSWLFGLHVPAAGQGRCSGSGLQRKQHIWCIGACRPIRVRVLVILQHGHGLNAPCRYTGYACPVHRVGQHPCTRLPRMVA